MFKNTHHECQYKRLDLVIVLFRMQQFVKIILFLRFKEKFPDIPIGYSGHELGFIPTLGAVALGAQGNYILKFH